MYFFVLFVKPSPRISIVVLGMLTKFYLKNAHFLFSCFSISWKFLRALVLYIRESRKFGGIKTLRDSPQSVEGGSHREISHHLVLQMKSHKMHLCFSQRSWWNWLPNGYISILCNIPYIAFLFFCLMLSASLLLLCGII